MDRDEPLPKESGVTLQYKTRSHIVTATYRVGFEMLKSGRFVLLGPSGCGKSTLQKAVGGYIAPTEGEMRLKGKLITKPGPDCMMVFQEFDQLLPRKTVQQNVAFALEAAKRMTKREAADRAAHYVDMVGLSTMRQAGAPGAQSFKLGAEAKSPAYDLVADVVTSCTEL